MTGILPWVGTWIREAPLGCGDGRIWNPEIIADRIRRGLDVIGSTEGGILYRGPEYWEVLPPGEENQVLLIGPDGVPIWGEDPSEDYKLWTDDFSETTAEMINNYGHVFGAQASTFVCSGGNLVITGGGGGGTNYSAFVPTKLGGAVGQQQFCEVKYVSRTNAGRAFIGVCLRSDQRSFGTGTNSGYCLLWIPESSQLRLEKITNGAIGTSSPFGTMSIPATGSIVALTAEWTGSGTTTLKVWDDGSVIFTAVDSGGPYQTGLPGFGTRDSANTTSVTFDDLRCGNLSEF